MMRPCILPGCKKAHRLQIARVAGIENGHPIAEHVADIEMLAIGHDLDAVRTPANVAVGNMFDPMTDPLGWDRRVLGAGHIWHPGQRRHAQQTPQMRAAALHDPPLGFWIR